MNCCELEGLVGEMLIDEAGEMVGVHCIDEETVLARVGVSKIEVKLVSRLEGDSDGESNGRKRPRAALRIKSE